MNSVAVPASAPAPSALGAEGDLVRLAARGDAESFAELFRRHAQPAWRLAQAVAADRDSAVDAFRSGFVRALGGHRLARREGTSNFRTSALAAVYKAAADKAANRAPAAPSRRASANADVALADAAFRSLPDRWRAAVWLAEVENFDLDRIAPVLGVSNAVASQLVARGRRALAGRFTQAHREVPDLFGPVLRPIAMTMPSSLAETTRAHWSTAGSEREPIVAPIAQWLEQKAVRPMTVAVGALIGLGLIGLGVVPQGSAMRAQLGADANRGLGGAVPAQTCFGLACPGGSGLPGTSGALAPSTGFAAPTGTGGGGGTLTGSSLTTANSPNTGSQPGAPTPTSTSGSGPSAPSGGGGSGYNPGSGSGPTTSPAPSPTLSTPLANLTVTSSSASVTLLPSSGGSGAGTATLSTSGSPLCVTSGQTSVGCSTTTPTGTSNDSTSSSSTLSGTTSTITKTITNTVSGTGL
ncbi:MAG TPA: sigma-70 family RNA polymerase sigma factor [Acidimicrobiales bacterium]|nr:sigma-70 family RNA polymerase sigma factor [Acidimicrobiales bacterium]